MGLSGVKVASAGVVGGQIRATKWEADYVEPSSPLQVLCHLNVM